MKKLLLGFILISFTFGSCKKDDEDCNCGVINNDGIDNDCYWLEITSDCSGNRKTFCFDENVWLENHPGDNFCVTNEPGW